MPLTRKIQIACVLVLGGAVAFGGTTIDPLHPHAYGANIGWLDARGDVVHGAVVGTSYCTGYVWSANCGWIGLGHGPTNGWHYTNASHDDWGVNQDGTGRLTGFAYGANIGWLNFEQTYGQPRIDLRTGDLSGHVWIANAGWISLANVQAHVRTATLDPGPDVDADGIPDAWEYAHTGQLGRLHGGGADWDGDGATDSDESVADTNPCDLNERFAIASFTASAGTNVVSWFSRPTRLYRVETADALPAGVGGWRDAIASPIGPPDTSPSQVILLPGGATQGCYRVCVSRPLSL